MDSEPEQDSLWGTGWERVNRMGREMRVGVDNGWGLVITR